MKAADIHRQLFFCFYGWVGGGEFRIHIYDLKF